jgi:very-short-patch-repair endonuclease
LGRSVFRSPTSAADLIRVDVEELPPLTGSQLLDPWRIRYRRTLAGESLDHGLVETPRPPTRSETLLWSRLQQEPHDWQAEVPTAYGCVLDFYCHIAQLAVEVDGGYHQNPRVARRDDWRDDYHQTLGIETKRFTAREVETDLDWVVEEIRRLVSQRLEVPRIPGSQRHP